MKLSQNTNEKILWKKYILHWFYWKLILHFGCSVSFDREQHKCDPQMNNTRGLIHVYINSIIKLDMNISHFCHNIMVQLVLLQ